MMCLSFVHQLCHPHVGTRTLSTYSSRDLCWSASDINSGGSDTLGKDYDPEITTRRSVSWKVTAVGQRMLYRGVLKIVQEIKEPAAMRNLFRLWFPGGGDGENGSTQPAGAFCCTWHSHPSCGSTAGGRAVTDDLYILIMLKNVSR